MIESIRIFGVDVVYLTRSLESVDNILNEDDMSIFNKAFMMEMYVKSVDGFEGEGDFLSKFGLTIRDQVTFTVAIRTFEKYATRLMPELNRPKEGDLIFFPMNNKFFKIMHVEHESVFYQTGALQVMDLKCELFEYSNERFQTGIDQIDDYFDNVDSSKQNTLQGLYDVDPIAKNVFFDDEETDIIDFSEIDPFSEVITFGSTMPSADDTTVTVDKTNITVDSL